MSIAEEQKEKIEQILKDNNKVIESSTVHENKTAELRGKLDEILSVNEQVIKGSTEREAEAAETHKQLMDTLAELRRLSK